VAKIEQKLRSWGLAGGHRPTRSTVGEDTKAGVVRWDVSAPSSGGSRRKKGERCTLEFIFDPSTLPGSEDDGENEDDKKRKVGSKASEAAGDSEWAWDPRLPLRETSSRFPVVGGSSITRMFGLRHYVTLSPALPRPVGLDESRGLLSALSLACDSCSAWIPAFCPLGHPDEHVFIGQMVSSRILSFHMEMLPRSDVPKRLLYLSGISEHLEKARRRRQGLHRRGKTDDVKVMVTASFSYDRNSSEWDTAESPSGTAGGSSSARRVCSWRRVETKDQRFFGAFWGTLFDPLEALRLRASWPRFPLNSFTESARLSELVPGEAPEWNLEALWKKPPGSPGGGASAALRKLLEGYLHIGKYPTLGHVMMAGGGSGSSVDPQELEGLWRVYPVGYLIRLRVGSDGHVSGENLPPAWPGIISGRLEGRRFIFEQTAQVGEGKHAEVYLASCAGVFDGVTVSNGTWTDSYRKKGQFWLVRASLSLHTDDDTDTTIPKRPAPLPPLDFKNHAPVSSGIRNTGTSGLSPVPFGSILSKVSMDLEERASAKGDVARRMKYVVDVWRDLVKRLRYIWENKEDVPDLLSEGRPDTHFCILHQKLQALQYCIRASRRSPDMYGIVAFPGKPACESSDSDGDGYTTPPTVEGGGDRGDGKRKETIARWGVRRYVRGVTLQEKGIPMAEPHVQDTCPLTSDLASSLWMLLKKLEKDPGATAQVLRQSCPGLAGAMEAFKAANPGSTYGDFAKWRATLGNLPPPAWDDTVTAGDLPVEALESLWMASDGIPVEKQGRVFKPAMMAERILDYLETISPKALAKQLAEVAVLNATVCMQMTQGFLCGIPLAWATVRGFERFLQEMSKKSGFPGSRETAELGVEPLRIVCRRFAVVEDTCNRAASLAYCLPGKPALLDALLTNGHARVASGDRAAVAQFFEEGESTRRSKRKVGRPLLGGLQCSKEYVFQNTRRRSSSGFDDGELVREGWQRKCVTVTPQSIHFACIEAMGV